MKFITSLLTFMLCANACIVKTDQAQTKFIAWSFGLHLDELGILAPKVLEPQWKIAYRYGVSCKPEERQNDKKLKEAISATIRTWLKPLKSLQPQRPFVDKFAYELRPDYNPDKPDTAAELQGVNLHVTFQCILGISTAGIGGEIPPIIFMRVGTEITSTMFHVLAHEMGHAFGLLDTYAREDLGILHNRGGLRKTAGKQPSSVMASFRHVPFGEQHILQPLISEDDKRGIIWLYRYFFDNQATDDCFFADYIFVEEPRGCRPKHPLIFETKHSHPTYVLQLLQDDPDIDINAQDVNGMTALHYAVLYEKLDVVKALLANEKIKPLLKNKQGETPLAIAQAIKNNAIVRLFPKQEEIKPPPPLNVAPKNKVITTWGAIKKE